MKRLPTTLPSLTGGILNGQSVTYVPTYIPSPTIYQWTLSVQRELPGSLAVEVAYVGSRGAHQWFPRDINQVPPNLLGAGNAQLNRPFPQYQSINYEGSDGYSTYNALQFKVTRRLAAGLKAEANYTYSRNLNTTSYDYGSGSDPVQNIYNLRAEYGPASANTPQLFNLLLIYEIPQFIHGTAGNYITRGWQLNNVVHANAGYPFNLTTSINQSGALSETGNLRPDRACNGSLSSPSISEWFNPSCFALPAAYSFGDNGRNVLLGPGFAQWDFSLFKNTYFKTPLNEQTNVQFRAEFFNFLNHPNWGQPNATIGSASAGVITSAQSPRSIDFGIRFVF